MRAVRFGPVLVMAATAVLGGCAAQPAHKGQARAAPETSVLTREYDDQLEYVLTTIIGSAEIGPGGEIVFQEALGDGRFLEPNSGRYWQVNSGGQGAFRSRSLWERKLEVSGRKAWKEPLFYDSEQFPGEPLRVAERTVRLPGSAVEWQLVVARARGAPAADGG